MCPSDELDDVDPLETGEELKDPAADDEVNAMVEEADSSMGKSVITS